MSLPHRRVDCASHMHCAPPARAFIPFPGRADGFALLLRCERRGKNAVALNRLGGCRAPEPATEGALAFHQKSRPHLLDDVRETDLEGAPRDRLEGHIEPKLSAFPELLFSAFEKPECLRFRGAEAHTAVGPQDLQKGATQGKLRLDPIGGSHRGHLFPFLAGCR